MSLATVALVLAAWFIGAAALGLALGRLMHYQPPEPRAMFSRDQGQRESHAAHSTTTDAPGHPAGEQGPPLPG